MKKLLVVVTAFLIVGSTSGQYYYNDIIGTQQANQQYKLFLANQLKKVTAISYEGNNQPSTDFFLEQTIDPQNQVIITKSKSVSSGETFFLSYYKGNRLNKTVDSSSNAINSVAYEYAIDGKIKAITTTNKDFDGKLINTEKHFWRYNEKGLPEGMLRIKNDTDTTDVSFAYDESGNVGEEIWKRKNRVTETYYYYYNAQQKLSDIVRYSKKAKRMLPDFIIEYDEKGRVAQMTQTQSASANYLVWKYTYNPQGLKDRELVYNKQKEFLGKVEYKYQ
jgi:YD repeat-containing protein